MAKRLRGFETVLILVATIALIAGLTALLGSVVLTRFVTTMLIDLVLVLGLQIFMGNTNILWFPHIGFMGIGAYASVIFSMSALQKSLTLPHLYPFLVDVHLPFLPALLAGALVAAVVAGIVGLPLMRLSDFPAVITGFALLVIIHVSEPPLAYGGGELYYGIPEPDDQEQQRMLNAVKPTDPAVPYEHRLLRGDPASAIVGVATREKADLIVIGTHGRGVWAIDVSKIGGR